MCVCLCILICRCLPSSGDDADGRRFEKAIGASPETRPELSLGCFRLASEGCSRLSPCWITDSHGAALPGPRWRSPRQRRRKEASVPFPRPPQRTPGRLLALGSSFYGRLPGGGDLIGLEEGGISLQGSAPERGSFSCVCLCSFSLFFFCPSSYFLSYQMVVQWRSGAIRRRRVLKLSLQRKRKGGGGESALASRGLPSRLG